MSEDEEEQVRSYPSENQSLSSTILAAIEEQKEEDLSKANFQLYDDSDQDALVMLFREDSSSDTTSNSTLTM